MARTSGDSDRMGEQPAVRAGVRRWWLIAGGVLTAIAVGFFVAALSLNAAITTTGIIVCGGLYLALVLSAVAIRSPRARGVAMAVAMILLAVSSLVLLIVLAAAESASGA